MWLLVFVVFTAPMQIDRIDILETHLSKSKCLERITNAKQAGIPKNASVGCVYFGIV
jgi:hypothetical protein